jgi:uncharacterized protein (TIGR02246 family)
MRTALALAFILPALLPPAVPADGTDRSALAALRQGWATDLRDKRLDASLERYADDAVFYNPDGSNATGKAQIRLLFEQVMRTYDSDLRFHSRAIAVSGALAYDSGDYEETLTPRDGGPVQHPHGNYLMVLRRGSDGRWRIERQMWTTAPMP